MKRILLLTIVSLLMAVPAFAGELSDVAVEVVSELITTSDVNVENNSAYVQLKTMSVLYMTEKETVSVLVMDESGNTLENSLFTKGSKEYEKISAVLAYKAAKKKHLLASVQ